MSSNLTQSQREVLQHWSEFGRPGQPTDHRVKSSEWKTVPFEKPVTSSWDVEVPSSELAKLLNGFSPSQMEDKWFVYADGPDEQGLASIHAFRSWTGYKIVEVTLEVTTNNDANPVTQSARITAITWESSEDKIAENNEEEAKSRTLELFRWVLGVELEVDTGITAPAG